MKFEIGDVFEVHNGDDGKDENVTRHFICQVQDRPARGRVNVKMIKVFKTNHNKDYEGEIKQFPIRGLFGSPKSRWFNVKRLSVKKYPEYYI